MAEERKLYLGGEWQGSPDKLKVENPYNNEVVATVSRATPEQIEAATARAEEAFGRTRRLPSHEREAILLRISQGLLDRTEEIARTMAQENGKPIRDARGEVARAVNTFKFAAEEAKRVGGEVIDLDWGPGSEGRYGIVRRFPIGPVLGITPFNFPLNLVAHKVAPAIAAGCPIVVKPASATPLSGLLRAEVCHDAGLLPGALSMLPCSSQVAEKMVVDERFKKITFTGSTEVGLGIKAKAPNKHVTLELGGNAGVIVHSDADLDYAVERCVPSSFYHAGQSCISIQRIFVHERVCSRFLEGFLGATEKLKMGDPLSEDTDLGPMIDEKEARRVESWVGEALDGGAELLTGGKREGAF
ncbi:MAG: aldehyde dehydrogenase family protein, partial [Nitrospinota bacterium]